MIKTIGRSARLKNLILLGIMGFALISCSDKESQQPAQPSSQPSLQPSLQQSSSAKQWINGWKQTQDLMGPRSGAATAVHNGVIYLIGGVDGRQFVSTTEYARVNQDGSLSPWQRGPDLLEERGFIEAAVHNGYIYVVGGGNGPNGKNLLQSVERAKIKADGSLDAWTKESNGMITPRRCSKVFTTGDYIYSLGGFAGALLNTVERASIQADGHLGPWEIEKDMLTLPRYVNAAKTANGFAYAIGGHDQTKGVGIVDVEWALPNKEAGGVGNWKATSAMQSGRYGLSSAAHGGRVYALGGLTGLEYLNSIELAQVNANGELSSWRYTTELSQPRAMFSTVVYQDWIYVIGGTNQDRYLNSVEYANFNSSGDIGFMGTAAEAQQYQAALQQRKQKKSILPNEGVVLHVQHASMYTYLNVRSNLGDVWLAGPKMDVKLNDKVRFSKGVTMSNFYSKELQQQFPMILFVSKINKVQ